ncbi:MAG: hypothetical protein JWP83_5618 [Mycobacterium sp.]|jgi:hypothetical protein|uniref:hypothetical protein n=1 Tax=Mycobacterium sp. TaxID=1785 RepID=UPI0026223068|nr:hypothetical protein [Mycobacterium sp.]MCW2664466.1 hypothetical protein [Mycobacterium sp.]
MHTTDTVDMEIILSGEILLELDDGVETTLAHAISTSKTGPAAPGVTVAIYPP